MFAASTPINPRKRKIPIDGCLTPGISPIKKRGVNELRLQSLPKLPRGTTLEVLRVPPKNGRPLAENRNMGNLPTSAIDAQTRKSLAYLDGIIAPVTRKPLNAQAPRPSQVPDSLNDILKNIDQTSKKNISQFPELVIISDDEDIEPKHSKPVHNPAVVPETRKSFSTGRKTIAAAVVPKSIAGSRSSIYNFRSSMGAVAIHNGSEEAGYFEGSYTTVIKSKPQYERSSRASAIVKSEKLTAVPENVFQPVRVKNEEYGVINESPQLPEPEITKFSLACVDVWKEMKDQAGIFFSKAPSPQSSGLEGEAFPARIGYLKMEAKKSLDIQNCANNVVFTVVKGKGRMKNKTEVKNSNLKSEIVVGDVLTVPQGATFGFTNLGTKNDLIMSYVKLS